MNPLREPEAGRNPGQAACCQLLQLIASLPVLALLLEAQPQPASSRPPRGARGRAGPAQPGGGHWERIPFAGPSVRLSVRPSERRLGGSDRLTPARPAQPRRGGRASAGLPGGGAASGEPPPGPTRPGPLLLLSRQQLGGPEPQRAAALSSSSVLPPRGGPRPGRGAAARPRGSGSVPSPRRHDGGPPRRGAGSKFLVL